MSQGWLQSTGIDECSAVTDIVANGIVHESSELVKFYFVKVRNQSDEVTKLFRDEWHIPEQYNNIMVSTVNGDQLMWKLHFF